MIEAVARSRAERECPGVWPEFSEEDREDLRVEAAGDLAAALGVCEVREEYGNKFWLDGAEDDPWEDWPSPGFAENRVKFHAAQRALTDGWRGNARLIRRLVITSPAEQVDTEGAP